MTPGPRVSVVVRGGENPDLLITCLEHLGALRTAPDEIIVIAPDTDESSRRLVTEKFPDVVQLRLPWRPGRAQPPWQAGLARAGGDVVAFLDDDTRVDELWLDALTAPYTDPAVSAVGGRVVSAGGGEDLRDEAMTGLASIGRVLPSGELTSYFGADPGRQVEVDHLPESNMSFRTAAVEAVGGFRVGHPGSGRRDATDLALRLGAAGYRLVFAPQAVTRRDAATTEDAADAERTDLRHLFGTRRDHLVLLVGAYGWTHALVRRYPATTVRDQHRHLRAAYRLLRGRPDARGVRPSLRRRASSPWIATRSAAELAGLAAGVLAALRSQPERSPARRPDDGRAHDPAHRGAHRPEATATDPAP